MPLTHCRMRVNVNEKYIIHIPVEWSCRASRDASSLRRERKEDKARLHHLLSVLLILWFLFFWRGGGRGLLRTYTTTLCSESIFVAFQNKLGAAWHRQPLHLLFWQDGKGSKTHLQKKKQLSQNDLRLSMRITCNDPACWLRLYGTARDAEGLLWSRDQTAMGANHTTFCYPTVRHGLFK